MGKRAEHRKTAGEWPVPRERTLHRRAYEQNRWWIELALRWWRARHAA